MEITTKGQKCVPTANQVDFILGWKDRIFMTEREQRNQPRSAGASVTARALAILSAFEQGRSQLSLSDIARRAHLPVSTAHRLVTELVEWGALERTRNRYVIGHRLWKLGLLAPVRRDIAEVAAPYMQDVLFVTHNVVNLFVLQSENALLLERISGTRVGAPFRNVGDLLPLHASAAGKVLVAYAAQSESLLTTAKSRLASLTPHTITSPEAFEAEIQAVYRNGFAMSKQEAGLQNFAIAVPILDHDGYAVAALGVVHRELPSVGSVVPVLRIAARGIARRVNAGFD